MELSCDVRNVFACLRARRPISDLANECVRARWCLKPCMLAAAAAAG